MKSIFITIFLFQIVVAYYDFLRSNDESPEAKCMQEAVEKLGPLYVCPGTVGETDPVKLAIAGLHCGKKIFLDAKCGDEAKWKELCLRAATLAQGFTVPPKQAEILKAIQEECNK